MKAEEKYIEAAKKFAENYYQLPDSNVETVRMASAIKFAARFAASLSPKEEEEKERGITIICEDTSSPPIINSTCNHINTKINWAGQIECNNCKKVF